MRTDSKIGKIKKDNKELDGFEVLKILRKLSYKKQRDYLLITLDIMARSKKRDITDCLAEALGINNSLKILNIQKKYNQSKTKVHISGNITNDINYKLNFYNAERILRENGFIPLNPCKNKKLMNETIYLKNSIRLLKKAGLMVQISNPKECSNMRIEEHIAKKLKIPVSNYCLDQRSCK